MKLPSGQMAFIGAQFVGCSMGAIESKFNDPSNLKGKFFSREGAPESFLLHVLELTTVRSKPDD